RGLFAGIALDGAVLSINDEANQAVYGQGTTPRMIFEGRTAQQPSDAVVDFRDRLEEATALARAERGTEQPLAPAETAETPSGDPATADGAAADTLPLPLPESES